MITTITQNDLDLHAAWLRGEEGGAQLVTAAGKITVDANLSGADLSGADLSDANLRRANLRGAGLSRADLSGADVDFSCWPLWCGSNHVIVDARIAAQLAAHFCALDCDDPAYKAARDALLPFARTSHRAGDLGLLDVENE